jgi:hypothetical protein
MPDSGCLNNFGQNFWHQFCTCRKLEATTTSCTISKINFVHARIWMTISGTIFGLNFADAGRWKLQLPPAQFPELILFMPEAGCLNNFRHSIFSLNFADAGIFGINFRPQFR